MAVADNEAKGFDNPAYAGEGQDELASTVSCNKKLFG